MVYFKVFIGNLTKVRYQTNIIMSNMCNKVRSAIIGCGILMFIFMIVKISVIFDFFPTFQYFKWVELGCFVFFVPIFCYLMRELVARSNEIKKSRDYTSKLNTLLVDQINNDLYYEGDINNAAKILTQSACNGLGIDRAGVWLFDYAKKKMICNEIFIKNSNSFRTNDMILVSSNKVFFEELKSNPYIIIENGVNYSMNYIQRNNINSCVIVPIWFKGDVIGMITFETINKKVWLKEEIDFVQLLTSTYSFGYAVYQNNLTAKDLMEFEKFIDRSVLVSKSDASGKITYVNKKFQEVSGWDYSEIIGKDHNLFKSGEHTKAFWNDMFNVILKEKRVWNKIIANKNKNGDLYWVDSYIKGDFDNITGKLIGYTSIRYDVTELIKSIFEIEKKNTYLEHAAKILRHDMHSGINTYMPRGISSLERRLNPEIIKQYKLDSPLKMIKEGLKHTQKIYKGVYEFTNLVKKDTILEKESCDLKKILADYLSNTAYVKQVAIDYLPTIDVNSSLFCTAIDNLIRNGLKYNDSEFKMVAIFMLDDEHIGIQDNGRGMTQEEFEHLSKPYTRKIGQKEVGTGLGLSICIAILKEHGFEVSCEKNESGTLMKIKIK